MKKVALPIFVIAVLLSITVIYLYDADLLHKNMNASRTTQDVPAFNTGDTVFAETQATDPSDVVEVLSDETVSSFAENVLTLQDPALDAICERYHAIGVQCAVIHDGLVTGSYVYGMADRESGRAVTQDTKYRVASLSKLFTNMIFMQLSENGLVDLDADIGSYYGFTVRNPSYPDVAITPRMLMTHTASVIDGRAFERSLSSESSLPIESVLSDRSSFSSARPGTSHVYSNFSNALIGSICELTSGVCFEELAQSLFLDPLNLDGGYVADSIENISELGLLYGGSSTLQSQLAAAFNPTLGQTVHLVQGNLTISAKDYAQLLCVLLNNGTAADGTRLLCEESVGELLSVQYENSAWQVGLGCFVYNDAISGKTLYCHTGSAYGLYACYAIDPVSGDGVVALTSGADYSVDSQTEIYNICLDLIRALFPKTE